MSNKKHGRHFVITPVDKNGEVWCHLAHQKHPPTRASRAERGGPESVDVHSAQMSSGLKRENGKRKKRRKTK
ncbi:hypothetical protein TYRP_009638 [Tyrophagus putrescentiae]|nr:hypothetical protein TYRP_009638 [Tyrophagus putrescentiae]